MTVACPLENTIMLLIGFAGTGKYTIGLELAGRTGARLIDNHLVNNPVFTVMNPDGLSSLPDGVWAKTNLARFRATGVLFFGGFGLSRFTATHPKPSV